MVKELQCVLILDTNGRYTLTDSNGNDVSKSILRKIIKQKPLKSKKQIDRVRLFYLYALRLRGDKYYIGVTAHRNAEKRFEIHKAGRGAKWTVLHEPIEIIEVRPIGKMPESKACKQETLMTIEYMDTYGIQNVRGGSMCYLSTAHCESIYNKLTCTM